MDKKYKLYAKINIAGEEEKILVLETDLRSMQIYFSYCTGYSHFINTIKRTNSKTDGQGEIVYDISSLKTANFILSEIEENKLEIEDKVPIFYDKDRDAVLATKQDITNVIDNIEDESIIDSLKNFLENQLSVYNQGKSLSELIDIAQQNYRVWLSFNIFLKYVSGKRLIEVKPGATIDEEYRERIDEVRHENHISIYEQIIENILPYVKLKEKLKIEQEEAERKKEILAAPAKEETEEEQYKRMLKTKEFEETLLQDDEDDYEDDFLGPTKPNDERYHLIN